MPKKPIKVPKVDTTYTMRHEHKIPTVKELKGLEEQTKKTAKELKGAILKGHIAAVAQIERELPVYLTAAMLADVWSWPGITKRKNGEEVGTIRDISDLGTLAKSLKINSQFLQTKSKVAIKYTAPHAELVHGSGKTGLGTMVSRGGSTYTYPARPWVWATLNGGYNGIEVYDIRKVFEDNIKNKIKGL